MDTGNQFANQFGLWSQRIFAWIWYLLRSPALTGVLLLILVVVLVLRVTIPQQASPDTIAVVWATSLPPLGRLVLDCPWPASAEQPGGPG
jgi:hypothetical protein